MANEFVQTMADARVDAQSLSDFVFKPSGFKVVRRLAPTIDTLQFYINRFNTLDGEFSSSVSAALSSLNNSVAEADGKVAYIETTVQDAINNTAVEGGILADTFVTITSQNGSIPSNLRGKINQILDVSDFVDFNAADHTTGLLNAVAAAKSQKKGLVCRDTRTLKITDVVNMSGISRINFSGDISCRSPTAQVIVGGFANSGTPPEIYFMDITNLDSVITKPAPANPLLVVKGMKGGCVTVGNCNYMQLYADATLVATSSNAYTRYYLKGVTRKFEITDSGVGKSWVTENFIYGGRIGELVIKGVSYVHNHNKFYNPTIEGSTFRLYFDRANQNAIYGVRAELVASAVLEFTKTASYNKFVMSWSWTFDARGIAVNPFTIVDAGRANNVVNEAVYMYDLQHIVTADKHTVAIANDTDSASTCVAVNPADETLLVSGKAKLTPSINGFVSHTNRYSVLTDYVPVNSGDVITFDVECDSSGLRAAYWLYDENYKPITDTTDAIIQTGVIATSSTRYGHTANVGGDILSRHHAMIDNSQVKYVRIGVWSSAATFVNHIRVGILKKRGLSSTSSKVGVEQASQTLVMAGKPTMGYVPLNTLMYDTVANAQRRVTFAQRSELATPITATDTTATVTVVTGVANGDIYGILLPSGKTSWGLVSGLTSNSFTITATGDPVAAGALVVFNRWSEPPVVTPTP